MSDTQTTIEKSLAVGVGSAFVASVGLLMPKHGVSYLPEVSHNTVSLST